MKIILESINKIKLRCVTLSLVWAQFKVPICLNRQTKIPPKQKNHQQQQEEDRNSSVWYDVFACTYKFYEEQQQ